MKLKWLFLVLLLAGCGKIETLYDTQTDFKNFKSFCWLEGCQFTYSGPAYLNDSLVQARVKNSIIGTMQSKGLTYNDDDPDLLVDFHITIENQKVIYYHGVEDEPSYYRTSFLQPEELILSKGSLLIHMVDKRKSEVIWQSFSEGYLDNPPDLSESNIRKGIERVMKNFPPR